MGRNYTWLDDTKQGLLFVTLFCPAKSILIVSYFDNRNELINKIGSFEVLLTAMFKSRKIMLYVSTPSNFF